MKDSVNRVRKVCCPIPVARNTCRPNPKFASRFADWQAVRLIESERSERVRRRDRLTHHAAVAAVADGSARECRTKNSRASVDTEWDAPNTHAC